MRVIPIEAGSPGTSRVHGETTQEKDIRAKATPAKIGHHVKIAKPEKQRGTCGSATKTRPR